MLLALGNVDKRMTASLEVRVTDHAGGSGEGDIQPAVTEHDQINFAMRVRLTIKKQRMENLLTGEKFRFRLV